MTEPNSDNSYFRWICSAEEKSKTFNTSHDTSFDGITAAVYEKTTAYTGMGAELKKPFAYFDNVSIYNGVLTVTITDAGADKEKYPLKGYWPDAVSECTGFDAVSAE